MDTPEQEVHEDLAPEARAICDAIRRGAQAIALGHISAAFITTAAMEGTAAAKAISHLSPVDAETILVDAIQRVAAKLGILS